MPLAQKYMPATLAGVSSTEQFLLPSPWHTAMKSCPGLDLGLDLRLVVEPTRRAPVLADAVVVGRVPRLGRGRCGSTLTMLGSFDLSNFSSRPFWIICGMYGPVGTTMSNPLVPFDACELGDEVFVAGVVADLHLDAEVLLGQRTDDVGVVVGAPGVHVEAARRLVGRLGSSRRWRRQARCRCRRHRCAPAAAVPPVAGAGVPAVVPPAVVPPVASLAAFLSSPQAARMAMPAAAPPTWKSVRRDNALRKLSGARILIGSWLDDMTLLGKGLWLV